MTFQAGSIFVDLESRATAFTTAIDSAISSLANLAIGIQSTAAAAANAGAQFSAGLFKPVQGVADALVSLAVQDELAIEQFKALANGSSSVSNSINQTAASVDRLGTSFRSTTIESLGAARGFAKIGTAVTKIGALVSLFASTSSDAFQKLGRAGTALQGVLSAVSTAFLFGFGKVGTVIVAVGALVAALVGLKGATEEEQEAAAALQKELDELAGSANESAVAIERLRDLSAARLRVAVRFGADEAKEELSTIQGVVDATVSSIAELKVTLADVNKRLLNPLPADQFDKLKTTSVGTAREIRRLEGTIPPLVARIEELNRQEAEQGAVGQLRGILIDLSNASEQVRLRLKLGLIDPVAAAAEQASIAERRLLAFTDALANLSRTAGAARARELLGTLISDPAGLERTVAQLNAQAAAIKQAAEEQKIADEEAKKAAEERLRASEDLQVSFQEFLDDLAKQSDEIREQISLTDDQRKIAQNQARLQDFINSAKITETDLEQARLGIAQITEQLQESVVAGIEKEIEARIRAIAEQERQATAIEQAIELEREFVNTFSGTQAQLDRVSGAFDRLREAAEGQDRRAATQGVIEFNRQLEREIAATTQLSEAEAVRETILERQTKIQELAANKMADQIEIQSALANIEKLRVALNDQIARDAEEQVERFTESLDVGRQNIDQATRLAEIQSEIARRFPDGIPANVQLKLDQAAVTAAKADFDSAFASPFSQLLGGAVRGAILEGRDAMQSLADLGRGLFENFIGDATKKLQDGVSAALTNAIGAGGAALATGLTAALGAVGLLLSRGRSQATQTFAGVQGAVQSVQASRGIVAGPQSVAVATLGSDLQRAQAPVVVRLDAMIRLLSQIAGQGGRGVPNVAFAGNVPTQ